MDNYIIRELDNFDLNQIANSGQCFRFKKIGDSKFETVHLGKVLVAEKIDSKTYRFYCDEQEWKNFWWSYFDLDTDYSRFGVAIANCGLEYIKDAYNFSKGIRILNQEPFEMIISYIISQRNRIERISNCVEKLSEKYGNKIEGTTRYAFPNVDSLAKATELELTDIGLGYRVEYIIKATRAVQTGMLNLDKLKEAEYYTQLYSLSQLKGVGPKVANCVILFGLHNLKAFPIDVWIERIIDREFGGQLDVSWCSGFAGVVQQYMFYYERCRTGRI